LEQLVEDLKKLNVEYENQNKELRELHQQLRAKADELNIERIKALESTKLKSQFLTNITHELKTPLNSIIGLSDLINKDDSLSDSNKNRLTVIIRNGKKLLNLINNILEFSRAEAGKTVVKNETFILSHFIDEINSYIQPYALEKGLNYICETTEDVSVLLHTDKTKLEQILINLLNNAIKFTDEGFVKLIVSLEKESEIRFDVIDTGIGIEEQDQEVIFEEFRQADGTISRQHDGTGLGLSICKRFTELLNGTFSLQSEYGKGSKFTVLLKEVVLRQSASGEFSKLKRADNKRVIILDDYATNRKLISDYLKLNEYSVVEFSNHTENILTYLKQKSISKIIINQDYNDYKGWSILEELIRDNESLDVVPIIMATDNERNYGYGLAVYDYISENNYETKCSLIIPEISKKIKKDDLKIVSASNVESLNEFLKVEFSAESTNVAKLTKHLFEPNELTMPDVVFVDIAKLSVELIEKLKHNRQTRKIQFVGVISNDFDKNKLKLIESLKQTTKARKHHVIDVLKIIRDRFQISENEISKAKLLIDDDVEDAENTQKNAGERKVLIVDDDRDTLFTVGEIVKSTGFKPLFAKNGIECILTLKHEIPDLILLDIMMPKMDGFETLKEIRKNREFDKIPVVALTAYAMIDDKDIINKSGFNDIITKPIDTLALTTKLNEIFKGH
jgi:signal transduction histidine kinase/DNA-binding response OmpR family regulator